MKENKTIGDTRIDLSRNENPRNPSINFPGVNDYNKYSVVHGALIKQLARKHNVDPNQIVVGNGSTEVLDTICRAFLDESHFILCDKFLYPPTRASILRSGAMLSTSSQDVDSDIFIVNPCCVSGRVYNPHEIEVRLETGKKDNERQPLVVVDEAYIDYHPRIMSFINSGANIRSIVTRTFSKAYGLAGLRIGYAVCSRISDAIEIQKIQPGYNLSFVSANAAIQMLNNKQYMSDTIEMNNIARDYTVDCLDAMKIERMEPAGNFISAKVPDIESFIVRNFMVYGMDDSLKDWRRITISTFEIMTRYFEKLGEQYEDKPNSN